MTLSQGSVDHIPGIETSFGPDSVPEDAVYTKTSSSAEGRPTSANEKRRRLSSIFRVGVFLTKSKKSKKTTSTSSDSKEDQAPISPPSQPVMKKQGRRMSRLEMNEPIEEVFAGLKFDVLEKPTPVKPVASISSDISDDQDLIEDPDEIVLSTLEERRQSEQTAVPDNT